MLKNVHYGGICSRKLFFDRDTVFKTRYRKTNTLSFFADSVKFMTDILPETDFVFDIPVSEKDLLELLP